jgi:4-amino-4-deoxy-L-arabinose transferase-like glycosyltransferase
VISFRQFGSGRGTGGLLALLLVTAIWRGVVLWVSSDSLTGDPDSYRQYAQTLIEQGGFLRNGQPSAWRPPLYPLLFAGCLLLPAPPTLSIAIAHWLLGMATVWLVVLTARLWNLRRGALLAGLFVAVDPILVRQSTEVMTETLAATLAALVLLVFTKQMLKPTIGRASLAGAALGLAILCRPTFLLWALLLPPLVGLKQDFRTRLRLVALYGVAVFAILVPWAIRNAVVLGRPVFTTTHGGYTLLLGNNPDFYRYLKTRQFGQLAVWDSSQFVAEWRRRLLESGITSEIAEDRLAYGLAWQNIRSQPLAFTHSIVYRLSSFWHLTSRQMSDLGPLATPLVRLAVTFWYGGLLACALLGLLQLERTQTPPAWLSGLLLAVSFSAVHAAYWTDMRMRAPVMPAVVIAAAAGCAGMADWRMRRSTEKTIT